MLVFLLLFADAVIFHNGDRLTGEIRKLENNRLTLQTAHAGLVLIDWSAVDRVTSDRPLRLESSSGKRTVAPLRDTRAAGLVSIGPVPAQAAPEKRLSGHTDFGYNLTRGNTRVNQSSFGTSAEYRRDGYRLKTDVTSLFSSQPGAQDLSKHHGSVRLDHYVNPRAFTFGLGSLERDDREQLKLRSNVGAGLGWKIVQSSSAELSLLSGATLLHEQFDPADPNRSVVSGEGLAALTLDKAELRGIQFTSKLTLLPNFVDTSRYRLTFDGGVRVPVAGRFTWGVKLFNRFDSRPPQNVRRNDYGLIQNFGVRF